MAPPRRRQRRLRAQWRHEQQTVAVVLAAALHHSAGPKVVIQQHAALRGLHTGTRAEGEVESATNNVLRYQKTPPPWVRPGLLREPGPQRSDRTVRRSAGDAPPLAMPVLAAAPDEVIDSARLSCLARHGLEMKKEVEEEDAGEERGGGEGEGGGRRSCRRRSGVGGRGGRR